MERRKLLVITLIVCLCITLTCGTVFSLTAKNEIVIAQLKYKGGDYEPYKSSLNVLSGYVVSRTSVILARDKKRIAIQDKDLFLYPLLYMAGAYEFKPFSDGDVKKLRKYLDHGGTLFIDDSSGQQNSGFDRGIKRLVKRLYPEKSLEKIDEEHAIFRSFYLFKRVPGRKLISPFLFGINTGDITPVIYSKNDLGGAYAGDNFGGWDNDCTPGGERQREMSIRLGINIIMYTLTVNYKKDQVHIPFILQRRK
ncbi:DUF4159 domain-containing protein [Thermodesulfobacteriota bacterium]